MFRCINKFVFCLRLNENLIARFYTYLCPSIKLNCNLFFIRNHIHIHNMSLWSLKYVAITENTVEPEEILILQIASAAPFQHFHTNCVLSFYNSIRNVKLCLQMTSLCKSDIGIIDVQKRTGGNTFKYKINASPLLCDFKFTLIYTTGIIIRNIRQVTWIRKINIGIIRILITLNLPTGRNRCLIPFLNFLRYVNITSKISELPCAI